MGQRDDLETLRAGLLTSFAAADHAVKAQIAGQLRAVIKELAVLDRQEPSEVSKVDELAAKRKGRGAAAGTRTSAGRRREVRRS